MKKRTIDLIYCILLFLSSITMIYVMWNMLFNDDFNPYFYIVSYFYLVVNTASFTYLYSKGEKNDLLYSMIAGLIWPITVMVGLFLKERGYK